MFLERHASVLTGASQAGAGGWFVRATGLNCPERFRSAAIISAKSAVSGVPPPSRLKGAMAMDAASELPPVISIVSSACADNGSSINSAENNMKTFCII